MLTSQARKPPPPVCRPRLIASWVASRRLPHSTRLHARDHSQAGLPLPGLQSHVIPSDNTCHIGSSPALLPSAEPLSNTPTQLQRGPTGSERKEQQRTLRGERPVLQRNIVVNLYTANHPALLFTAATSNLLCGSPLAQNRDRQEYVRALCFFTLTRSVTKT